MRKFAFAAAAAAAVLAAAVPAAADTLIGFTDNSPTGGASIFLGGDRSAAVNWTQTVAAQNVTLSAILRSNVGAGPANWWLTTALGPAATTADIVASGVYQAPVMASSNNFDTMAYTTLATGLDLDLAAGDYYLVLRGVASPTFDFTTAWIGDTAPTTPLAPGFTLGAYSFSPTGGPFGAFNTSPLYQTYVFGLESLPTAGADVPEPATWALMLAGFGAVGAVLRRRERAVA